MRITADIIEEDSSISSKEVKRTDEIERSQIRESKNLQEVTEKLKVLNLYDIPSSSFVLNHYECASGSSNPDMEGCLDPLKKEDSPPPWLKQYMTKMKSEIKRELLEELLTIAPEFKQSSDIHTSKTVISSKEENQLHYQGEVVHTGIYCDNCDQLIHGIRYKCGNCSDFDLCQECETLPNVHNKNHIFLKIRYPFALKLYQKQKWQELMPPMSMKPPRFSDSACCKSQSKKLYEAKFLCDETVPDSTVIPPSTRFVKSWKVMNSGTRVWTHATKLHLIQGSADLVPISQKVDVPHLKPGEEGIISVLFTSPPSPGVYRSHWNFCHKSRPFGHIVWCHIVVKENSEESQMKQSNIDDLSSKVVNKQVEVSNIAEVLTAVKEEHVEDNLVPRKLIVNSHTATPNNTPFALTPPKSPDHESLTKSVCEIASEKSFLTQQITDSDNEDDEGSVVSISSTDSDTEFVVIPMPKCFNLSESFMSQHLRLPHSLIEAASNPVASHSEELKVTMNVPRKATPVSQETGVPELSENYYGTCHASGDISHIAESYADNQTEKVSHSSNGGSSSEISIIESEKSSPTVENATTQTFDTFRVTVSTDTSDPGEVEQIQIQLIDGPNVCDRTASSNETIENLSLPEQSNIPCNATFPKFPVEGVTGEIYEKPLQNNLNTDERTVQVLPEGLVIGALSAAASVYNTAKAVISTIQQPKAEIDGLSQPLPRMPEVQTSISPVTQPDSLNPMQQLVEMGFCNRHQNEILLKKHSNDVTLVVAELVSMNDNDWYASRHSPPTPPGFLD